MVQVGATGGTAISGASGNSILTISNSGSGAYMDIASGAFKVQPADNVSVGTNSPACKLTRHFSQAKAAAQSQLAEPTFIGKHENGNDISLQNGIFCPYLHYKKILYDFDMAKAARKDKQPKKIQTN